MRDKTFLEQFTDQYAWEQAPAKRRFRFKKELNRGMIENHRLALTLGGVVDRAIEDNEGLQSSDYSTYQIFEKDDLVFKLIDLENIKTSRVGHVPRRGIMSPAYIRLERSSKHAYPRYYYWFFYGAYINNIFNGMGGGVRQNLTPVDLLEFPIPLPSFQIQKDIADFLDRETARVDCLINKKEELVRYLDEKFDAVLSRALNKISNALEKSDDNKSWEYPAPDNWKVRPLRAICSIFGRIGFRGYTTNDIVNKGEGVITLSPSNIVNGDLTLTETTYLSWEKYVESPEIQIEPGDIIFVKTGSTIGKAALISNVAEPMTINPQLVVFKKHKINSQFLWLVLTSRAFQYQVSWNKFGGSTPAMSQGHLGRLKIAFPENLNEQRDLAVNILKIRKSFQATKSKINISIDLLKEFRSALIANAITGKIDIKNWSKRGETDRRLDRIEEEMVASKASEK